MVVGNGIDIVKISRIEDLISNNKDRFLKKIFTEREIEYITGKNYNPETVAGMFATKEAVSKLLGVGVGKVNWKHMEISHNEKGKPTIILYDEGLEIAQKLGIENIELSISHEKEYAIASVIGEKYGKINIAVPEDIKNILPRRRKDSHKGTFGRVGIISGSKGMTGAPCLATMGALRSGSGLVYTIVPNGISDILSIKLTEAIIRPVKDKDTGHFILNSLEEIKDIIKDMDILAIGPGMGVDEKRIKLVKNVLLTFQKPVVLDADGINCISKGEPNILLKRKATTIITPHPGELSRLIGVKIKDIQKNRIKYSKYVSNKYNIITVLKGADTIVSNPKGDTFTNNTGNPGMATAGSGDVLTGVIASFLSQRIEPYEAAILGVYCHGLAGDLAKMNKGEYGMIARDILEDIPNSIKQIEP